MNLNPLALVLIVFCAAVGALAFDSLPLGVAAGCGIVIVASFLDE